MCPWDTLTMNVYNPIKFALFFIYKLRLIWFKPVFSRLFVKTTIGEVTAWVRHLNSVGIWPNDTARPGLGARKIISRDQVKAGPKPEVITLGDKHREGEGDLHHGQGGGREGGSITGMPQAVVHNQPFPSSFHSPPDYLPFCQPLAYLPVCQPLAYLPVCQPSANLPVWQL